MVNGECAQITLILTKQVQRSVSFAEYKPTHKWGC